MVAKMTRKGTLVRPMLRPQKEVPRIEFLCISHKFPYVLFQMLAATIKRGQGVIYNGRQ
jgi:hypothetical protein